MNVKKIVNELNKLFETKFLIGIKIYLF